MIKVTLPEINKMPTSSFYDNDAAWPLLMPAGTPLVPTPEEAAYIANHAADDPSRLALQVSKMAELKSARSNPSKPTFRTSVVVRQVQGYQVIQRKVPTWASFSGLCFPHHLSLEQCSSETTARYKASLMGSSQRMADLTGGFGVDLAFMAVNLEAALYVERQPELAAIVQHNYRQLGLNHIVVRVGEAETALSLLEKDALDLIYLDPARRGQGGGKVVALADCEPDVNQLLPVLFDKAPTLLFKLSPMLDITQALRELPQTHEVHVVAVDNECKELLFLLKRGDPPGDVLLTCINLKTGGQQEVLSVSRRVALDSQPHFQGMPGRYLYEPNASLLKAGLFDYLTTVFPVFKLHPHSHLYTADTWLPAFPGRGFEVIGWSPYHPKKVKQAWPELVKANLSCRHFPEHVDTVRKRLKLSDGGDDYLFATTLLDTSRVIIRTKKV